MAGIETYLEQIKNAIYGREVRQAIHDGIHQCYEDGKAGAVDLVAREQIAQLVAPSGEAPSAAEVTDARVGVDGATYTSLGDAVRGQVDDLKNANLANGELSEYMLNIAWKKGMLNGTTGEEQTTEWRSVTVDYIPVASVSRLHIPLGYSAYMYFYDLVNGSYVFNTYIAKQATSSALDEIVPTRYGAYMRIVNMPTDGHKIEDYMIACDKLYAKTQLYEDVQNLSARDNRGITPSDITWQLGGLRFATGEEYATNYRTRMASNASTADVDLLITPAWATTEIVYFDSNNARVAGEVYSGAHYVTPNSDYPYFRANAYRTVGGQIQNEQVSDFTLAKATNMAKDLYNLEVFDSYYLGNYKFDTTAKVQEFCSLFGTESADIESFLFFTDPHWMGADERPYFKQMAVTLQRYFNNVPASFIVDNGDWLGDSDTLAQACTKIGYLNGSMRGIFGDKYYPVAGNHDFNSQGSEFLSSQILTNLYFRRFKKLYYSFDGYNTRFFVLNSGTVSANETDEQNEQVTWFAESLLNGSSDHYAVFVHAYYVTSTGDSVAYVTNQCAQIANVYNNRQSVTFKGVTYDFSSATGRVEFFMTGHTHKDRNTKVGNIPIVVTTKTLDGYATTFEMVYADYVTRRLYCIRVGAGNNRTFNLDTGELV